MVLWGEIVVDRVGRRVYKKMQFQLKYNLERFRREGWKDIEYYFSRQ